MNKIIWINLLLVLNLSAEYTQKVKVPSMTFAIAEDKNIRVMQRNCQWCHSYGYILNQGKQPKEFWHKVVIKMREVYKAPITPHDEKEIVRYLYTHYGED